MNPSTPIHERFPFSKMSILEILRSVRIGNDRSLESGEIEFKPYWQVEKKFDENNKPVYPRNVKILNENLRDLCGLANKNGGIMLIGVTDDGGLIDPIIYTSAYDDAKELKVRIEDGIRDKIGKVALNTNFSISWEELEKSDGKKTVIFRIDVFPTEGDDFCFLTVKGETVLPVRGPEGTESYNAKEAIEYSKKRFRVNKLLEEKLDEKQVPSEIIKDWRKTTELFKDEKYSDVVSHSYRLIKQVMQKRYNELSSKEKFDFVKRRVFLDSLKYFMVTMIFISFILIGVDNTAKEVGGSGVSAGVMLTAIILAIIGSQFAMLGFARDEERNILVEHLTPGSVILGYMGFHSPAALAKVILWKMIRKNDKEMEIELLVWALVLFESFTPANWANKDLKLGRVYGANFGHLIFDIAEQNEAIHEKGYKTDEFAAEYIIQNTRIMINSLYRSEKYLEREKKKAEIRENEDRQNEEDKIDYTDISDQLGDDQNWT